MIESFLYEKIEGMFDDRGSLTELAVVVLY